MHDIDAYRSIPRARARAPIDDDVTTSTAGAARRARPCTAAPAGRYRRAAAG
eukprot:COSAG04_NODE_831_length_10013_cov_78.138894_1_plen_51_part_10